MILSIFFKYVIKYILERCVIKMQIITDEIIKNFEMYLYEEERSDNTIEKYIRDVRVFYEYIGGRELQKSDILEYKKRLCEKYAPKSVNSVLSSLNALFVFMNRYDLKAKTLKIQRRIFADKSKELTKAEYERLLTAAKHKRNERLYYLMQTIASTGIRVSEIKYVTCEAVKAGQAVINCKGKIRQIFLSQKLCKMLNEYTKRRNIEKGAVFVSRTGKPLDRSNVWKMLKDLCETAGVSRNKVFPHNFRHLFARTFYSLQKDIVRLADILGHSSIETTRIYTMESGTEHIKLIQKLGLLRC